MEGFDFVYCQRQQLAEPNELIITHVSNFRKVKRVEDVVETFYRIQQKTPAKLMMVGDGPERSPAEDLVKSLGIKDKVIFFGNSNEVDSILKYSDLFMLASETESFGLAALEAMACSVPVISTNAGGLPEVNVQGVTGFMSDIGQVDDMARNALHILKDNETLKQFKTNALNHSKTFSADNIVPIYEKIYQEAMSLTK